MRNSVEQLVTTVLAANDNVYPDSIGFDVANNVIAWVQTNVKNQVPVFDLVFVSEGWDENEYVEGFEKVISDVESFLQTVTLDSPNMLDNIVATDTVNVIVKRVLKQHGAVYDNAANEISKMILGYLVGYLTFYKQSFIVKDFDESFIAGINSASDNIINICRVYIY